MCIQLLIYLIKIYYTIHNEQAVQFYILVHVNKYCTVNTTVSKKNLHVITTIHATEIF